MVKWPIPRQLSIFIIDVFIEYFHPGIQFEVLCGGHNSQLLHFWAVPKVPCETNLDSNLNLHERIVPEVLKKGDEFSNV